MRGAAAAGAGRPASAPASDLPTPVPGVAPRRRQAEAACPPAEQEAARRRDRYLFMAARGMDTSTLPQQRSTVLAELDTYIFEIEMDGGTAGGGEYAGLHRPHRRRFSAHGGPAAGALPCARHQPVERGRADGVGGKVPRLLQGLSQDRLVPRAQDHRGLRRVLLSEQDTPRPAAAVPRIPGDAAGERTSAGRSATQSGGGAGSAAKPVPAHHSRPAAQLPVLERRRGGHPDGVRAGVERGRAGHVDAGAGAVRHTVPGGGEFRGHAHRQGVSGVFPHEPATSGFRQVSAAAAAIIGVR
eukprot:ctg_5218.g596